MKTLAIVILGIAFAGWAFADVESQEISFKLGPKLFLDGDVIRIDSVSSTSKHLEAGDTVTVRGKYRLDSRGDAVLAFYLSQTEGNGMEETDPSQIVDAKEGWHDFQASITIKHRGHLHLSFYDKTTGKPFGGVYFGTPEQVDQGMAVSLHHYGAKSES